MTGHDIDACTADIRRSRYSPAVAVYYNARCQPLVSVSRLPYVVITQAQSPVNTTRLHSRHANGEGAVEQNACRAGIFSGTLAPKYALRNAQRVR